MQGRTSHKFVDLSTNPFMRTYYTNKPFLFFMCAGNEAFYAALYLLHFTPGPLSKNSYTIVMISSQYLETYVIFILFFSWRIWIVPISRLYFGSDCICKNFNIVDPWVCCFEKSHHNRCQGSRTRGEKRRLKKYLIYLIILSFIPFVCTSINTSHYLSAPFN